MSRTRIITKSRYHNGEVVYADPQRPVPIEVDDGVPDDDGLHDPATFPHKELLPHYALKRGPQGMKSADIQSVPLAEQEAKKKNAGRASDKSPV